MNTLRQWFGPSKKEIWQQLASETGATFSSQGLWHGEKVQAAHGQWTITLDTHVLSTGKTHVTYTRLRAPYVNADQFRFSIYNRGLLSDFATWLGAQDVEVGHADFDKAFIIKASSEDKVRQLFANARLRELIQAQPSIYLSVRDNEGWLGPKFPEATDELNFQVLGVIKEVERLKQLFDLFAELLDELCRIGSAYEQDPGVKL